MPTDTPNVPTATDSATSSNAAPKNTPHANTVCFTILGQPIDARTHPALRGPTSNLSQTAALPLPPTAPIVATTTMPFSGDGGLHQQVVKTTPGPPRGVMVPLVLLVHPDPP